MSFAIGVTRSRISARTPTNRSISRTSRGPSAPRILDDWADRAILVCGTGVGACIAANKIDGIRAALCHDVYSAHQSVEHDDVNVLCLGAQIVGPPLALELIRTFLAARFSDEEHFRRRVQKIAELERGNLAL